MKALLLVGLVLALGAGVLLLTLDTPGRGARGEARPSATTEPTSTPEPRPPAPSDEPVATNASRTSVQAAAAPAGHSSFEGAVIADGAPLPGAKLSVLVREELLAEATTDDRGRFLIDCPALQAHGVLRVRARGFVPLERTMIAKPAGSSEKLGNIRLVKGRRLTGRVIDGSGRGVPDASLSVSPQSSGTDVLVSRTRSGADGTFEFADAPPGMVLVHAQAQGFADADVVHKSPTEPVEVRLEPGSELHIRLRTPRGQPVAGAEATITAQGDPRAPKRVATSDADGLVVFQGLGTTPWSLRVTHEDYRPAGRSQVRPGTGEEMVECIPWPAIQGTVRTAAGEPPPAGTRVQALAAAGPSDRVGDFQGGKEVDAHGNFRIGGLRAGDWRVRVSAPGFAPATSEVVRLGIEGDGFAGTIVLQSGGRLVFALTLGNQPLAGAEVEVLHQPPTQAQLWALAGARSPGFGQRLQSDPDGKVFLENLAPGSLWIAVFAEGSPPASSGPHEASLAAAPKPIPVALTRGARIEGMVRDKAGAPIVGAHLRIVDTGGKLGFPLTLASAPDGRYTSSWLPPSHYQVEAFAPTDPNRRSGSGEIDLGEGELGTLDLTL